MSASQRARGVVTAKATATMLRRDFVDQIGANRDPRTVTRTELVECIERVRDGVRGHAPPRPGLAPTFRARLYGLFETAVARGDVAANPLAGFRQPRQSRAQRLEQAAKRAGRMLSMDEIASAVGRLRRSSHPPGFRRLCPRADRARLAPGRDRSGSAVVDQAGDEAIARRCSSFPRRSQRPGASMSCRCRLWRPASSPA